MLEKITKIIEENGFLKDAKNNLCFTNKKGKHIEVHQVKGFVKILHYGYENNYQPIVFNVISNEDVLKYKLCLKNF